MNGEVLAASKGGKVVIDLIMFYDLFCFSTSDFFNNLSDWISVIVFV